MDVLFLGEGNFSFTASLVNELKNTKSSEWENSASGQYLWLSEFSRSHGAVGSNERPLKVVCSSFDSREFVLKTYPESIPLLEKLNRAVKRSSPDTPFQVEVDHDINAVLLQDHYADRKFHRICWNHPHLGVEDFKRHHQLMIHFLFACKKQLADDAEGLVTITILQGQAERWNLKGAADRIGFHLWHAGKFAVRNFEGYETRRNNSGGSFQNAQSKKQWVPGKDDLVAGVVPEMPSCIFVLSLSPPPSHLPEAKWEAAAPPGDPNAGNSDKSKKERPVLPFACHYEGCDRTFSSAQGLKTHVRQVHEMKKYGDGQQRCEIICPQCEKPCRDQAALEQHILAKHSGHDAPQKVTGTICPTIISNDYPSNRGDEADVEAEQVVCEACGVKLPGGSYQKHMELLGLAPHAAGQEKCPKCGREFRDARALHQHMLVCTA